MNKLMKVSFTVFLLGFSWVVHCRLFPASQTLAPGTTLSNRADSRFIQRVPLERSRVWRWAASTFPWLMALLADQAPAVQSEIIPPAPPPPTGNERVLQENNSGRTVELRDRFSFLNAAVGKLFR